MAIHHGDVAYSEHTLRERRTDVLSASPATNGGTCYGTISVTRGADLTKGGYDHKGETLSVSVKPGHELPLLAALGDHLRGLNDFETPRDSTLVGTRSAFLKAAGELGLDTDTTAKLIDAFTIAPAEGRIEDDRPAY
jgi:hypothetical protein